MESRLINSADPEALRMVFIVGPPRSGTTLLYEALATRFRFAYISNAAHRMYHTPAAATRLFSRCIADWRGTFKSRYGHISGWGSPNEGGWIWRRWIPEDHYLDSSAADALPVNQMRRTFSAMSAILRAPMLNKNVMHSVHMRLLDRVFPSCVFIALERSPADNIRSIVHARIESHGLRHVRRWLSVRPRGWEDFQDAPVVDQVAAQVYHTYRDISLDSTSLGDDRVWWVDYKGLCEDPTATMKCIYDFLVRNGIDVQDRLALPQRFRMSNGRPLPDNMDREVAHAVTRWWASPAIAPTRDESESLSK